MKTLSTSLIFTLRGILTAWLVAVTAPVHATTIWNGPPISFTHSTPTGNLQDQLTPGVIITRGSTVGGLYNSAMESFASAGSSPADTEWAVGSLDDYTNLTYTPCTLEAGNNPPSQVGTTFVVHLMSDDIYLSLTLDAWGGASGIGDRSFSYTRSTPAAAPPPTPTISITNPASGAVFAAPANVTIGADAAVSSGTVNNVQFFTNNVSAGSDPTAPFSLTLNNLAAGAYALTAAATAAGISATSAVVNITVVSPPTVSITNPAGGAVFAAPANVTIAASATVSGGTVTNVQFFTNNVTAGSDPTAPFSLAANSLAAGTYALKAVATASGITATSAVVNVSVVSPVAVNLSGATATNGRFLLSYTANTGLAYVVQSSSNLLNWVSLVTNVAPGSPVLFSNSINPAGNSFYRVGRLPNP